jgi:hypothetical protein
MESRCGEMKILFWGQLAKKYGVSDVAIHKHCKKMGIKLPGRGYWAKQESQRGLSYTR